MDRPDCTEVQNIHIPREFGRTNNNNNGSSRSSRAAAALAGSIITFKHSRGQQRYENSTLVRVRPDIDWSTLSRKR